jgi:hypothetical protein
VLAVGSGHHDTRSDVTRLDFTPAIPLGGLSVIHVPRFNTPGSPALGIASLWQALAARSRARRRSEPEPDSESPAGPSTGAWSPACHAPEAPLGSAAALPRLPVGCGHCGTLRGLGPGGVLPHVVAPPRWRAPAPSAAAGTKAGGQPEKWRRFCKADETSDVPQNSSLFAGSGKF